MNELAAPAGYVYRVRADDNSTVYAAARMFGNTVAGDDRGHAIVDELVPDCPGAR